eukprot:gene9633-9793_t
MEISEDWRRFTAVFFEELFNSAVVGDKFPSGLFSTERFYSVGNHQHLAEHNLLNLSSTASTSTYNPASSTFLTELEQQLNSFCPGAQSTERRASLRLALTDKHPSTHGHRLLMARSVFYWGRLHASRDDKTTCSIVLFWVAWAAVLIMAVVWVTMAALLLGVPTDGITKLFIAFGALSYMDKLSEYICKGEPPAFGRVAVWLSIMAVWSFWYSVRYQTQRAILVIVVLLLIIAIVLSMEYLKAPLS